VVFSHVIAEMSVSGISPPTHVLIQFHTRDFTISQPLLKSLSTIVLTESAGALHDWLALNHAQSEYDVPNQPCLDIPCYTLIDRSQEEE